MSAAPRLGAFDEQGGAPSGAPVTVEFRALTGAGSPVVDLKASDVTLKVDGRERPVLSFEMIQASAATGPQRPPVPPPFATNVLAVAANGPRDSLIVIDDESIAAGDEKRLALAVDQYLSGLNASDRVGVVTVQDRGLNVSLTSDRAKIKAAAAATVGRARAAESAEDSACRTRRVLDALVSVSGNFPAGGAPVTVLFFSTGVTPPGTTTMSRMGSSSSTAATVCEVQPRDYQKLEQAASDSTMNLHVVATSLAPSTTLRSGLENIAGISGNAIVELVKGGDSDMVRVVRENSVVYRVKFAPEMAERNGAPHKIEVDVKRTGVDVRTRQQMVIARPEAFAKNAQPTAAKDLLRDANAHRDFPFRAAAFSSQEPGSDKVKLMVFLEPTEAGVAMKSAVVGLYDAKGKLTVQGTAEAANLARTPGTIAILANPGKYRMRVASIDTTGRAGTVDADVTVALTPAGSLQLGSLILGVADGGSFAGRLTFGAEPAALGYVEVYGVKPGAKITAQAEISETENGPVLAVGTTKILGDGADGKLVILGGVPIAQLPPGDIVVRIAISIDGNPAGRVTHTLRKR
ncbi:MAG: hypothetical protein K8S21_09455 [Gemmatimonadetes bacterium]|nr:hypothetical protein [Gemmatimonadota bacterium]